ncbi:MAG: hypothetical protein NE330_12735 [Lentisphaeraceae bacterium]|nr:hypothetical protein [Lentisphaeraceae bacterium]
MTLLDKAERNFGKFAIQGLATKLAGVQILFFVILLLKQYQGFDAMEVVSLIRKADIAGTSIISDTILAIATPSATPVSFMNYLWMYFGTYLFVLYGNSLESKWGAFKFNAYILVSIILTVIFSQIIYVAYGAYASNNMISFLAVSVLLAAATHFPKFELLIYFILPVPLWIIGLITGGFMFFMIISAPGILLKSYVFASAFGAYFLFHFNHLKNTQKQKIRSAQFEKKVKKEEAKAFHSCKVCAKTEHDDKDLEFRIGDDGEEYCLEHISQAK